MKAKGTENSSKLVIKKTAQRPDESVYCQKDFLSIIFYLFTFLPFYL